MERSKQTLRVGLLPAFFLCVRLVVFVEQNACGDPQPEDFLWIIDALTFSLISISDISRDAMLERQLFKG